jgi:cysteine-rich repeat protein
MNLSGVVSISAGGTHTCALLADGTMRCWGGNYSGQLGNGEQVYSRKPVAVSGLGGVVSISAGGSHTCAVLSDGTARCWGENRTGQLGNAGSDRSLLPVSVSDLSGVASISAGELHTCAVLTNGGAACWGKNSRGQLGNGTTKNSSLPVPVSSLSGVASISAGYKHTCAVLTDGTARCWGANGVGQLGNWTVKNSSIPVAVHLTSCGNGVVDPREECDPPDRDSDCDWSCHSSPQFCGNAIIDQGEECDDGNSTWGDTCFQCSARKYFILNKPYMGHVSILRVDKRGISEAIVPASGALDGLSALAVEPDGSVLYALEATSSIPAGDASPPAQNRLLYLDPATGTIRDQLAFDQTTLGYAARPTAITRGNDGFLYVSADLNPGSRLLRIDPRNKVVTEVMTLSHTSQITTDNSGFLYSTGHLSVYQISLATHSISDFAQGRWSPDGFRSWQGLTFDAVTNEVWAVDVIEYYADLWSFDASSGAGTMHGTVDVYLDNTIPTLLIDTDADPLLPRQRSNEILKMFELANPRGVGPYARAWDRNIEFPIDIEMVDFSAR